MDPLLPTRRDAHGYGLLELLVALVLVSVVLGVIMMAFFRSSGQAERLAVVADRRQAARTAVQLIEREIRTAGSGWGRIPVYGNDSAGNADTLQAVVPGFSSPAADRKSTRLNSSHIQKSRMPSSA